LSFFFGLSTSGAKTRPPPLARASIACADMFHERERESVPPREGTTNVRVREGHS
jgi:hypothetical protein